MQTPGCSVFVLKHQNAQMPIPSLHAHNCLQAAPPWLPLRGCWALTSRLSSSPALTVQLTPFVALSPFLSICGLCSEKLVCVTLGARGTSRIPHSSQEGLLSAAGILITRDSRSPHSDLALHRQQASL